MDGTNGLKDTTLSVNVFTAPGKAMVGERPRPFGEALGFDPATSTLVFGEYDAVLVDAMTTVAEADSVASWVARTTATWRPSIRLWPNILSEASPRGLSRVAYSAVPHPRQARPDPEEVQAPWQRRSNAGTTSNGTQKLASSAA